jgi:hypothetical protein
MSFCFRWPANRSNKLLSLHHAFVGHILCEQKERSLVAHSSACNFFCRFCLFLLRVLSRPSFISRTPNKDQKTEQLFYFLLVQFLQPRDVHELRSKRFCACYSHVFPWFNHHSIALVLLYNMRLERSFSIKRFQSYTPLKIVQKLLFTAYIYIQTNWW